MVKISVFDLSGKRIGAANSFGDAKRMQEAALPDDIRKAYAGINENGDPLFYSELLTPELLEKYPQFKNKD